MNPNQRFSILTFPQFYDGVQLAVNVVVLPRDQNPLAGAIVDHATIPDAPAFADAALSFTANIFDTLAVFPHTQAPIAGIPLPVAAPAGPRAVFEALAPQLDIVNLHGTNSNADLASIGAEHKPAAARPAALTVGKYLPRSYRGAFNFTRPRHANFVTDDSYHCAIKDGEIVPGFTRSPNAVSWGKVFAYLLRQPFLARHAGLVYQTQLTVDAAHFPDGGWLWVDLSPDSTYRTQLDADPAFVRRYAARIPALTPGEPRQVFAAVQFPVQFKAQPADPDPTPAANYDDLFLEAAEYDDGFAKIVHCRQAPNRDRLSEDPDGNYPTKDTAVELGFDDEAIGLRYIRQMELNPAGDMDGRIDAPVGVFGYAIDVRQTAEPENPWESLNAVESRQPLVLPHPADPAPIPLGTFTGELPWQVYPTQFDGRKDKKFWLPMYFASWHGHSVVLPDPDAAAIYQTTSVDVAADPLDPVNDTGTGVTGPAANQLNQLYRPAPIATVLRYGNNYQFRARMLDLSGGAPAVERTPATPTASDVARCRFRRFISPNQPRILELDPTGNDDNPLVNSDTPTAIEALNVRRPKLGYPAVVFTGKYQNPVQRLIDQAAAGIQVDPGDPGANAEHRVGLGIADPDVDRIEITVEVASLRLDKLASVSGKDDYVHLYTTTRAFPAVADDDDYEAVLNVPIDYRDVHVLHTGDAVDLADDFDLAGDIDDLTAIVLPTGRQVRLTVRAVCEDKADNAAYYGVLDDVDKRLDNRYGETFQIAAYKPSTDETALLVQTPGVPAIQGIYMQPDLVTANDGRLTTLLLGNNESGRRANVQQLADRLNLVSNTLTLAAPKGERIVFGCSSRIRHTLAPDGSSLTFASKGDLVHHWLVAVAFTVDRDWMWDALEHRSFVIRRTRRFTHKGAPEETDVVVGDVEMVRTASFESLDRPDRGHSRFVFLDVVEPKAASSAAAADPEFPDGIELSYVLETQFRADHGQNRDPAQTLTLSLPVTTPPAQVPRIVSAGIALSPYERNERYTSSGIRRRQLWIEFAEPVKDPQDTVFARVLAVAPDQLLSRNDPALLAAPEEPALPIDPEYIRHVAPGATNDLAGLNAMQPMEKSTTSDRHYLLPLPPGLHANADEMFGFFTYEFRIGHFRRAETGDMVWCTAQGRYGRRLRATGIQHPAPTLTCMANRDHHRLWVTAPYAVAVHAGKNVTADPPRTELWALLYAQVAQADRLDFRNILLDDRQLDWRVQIEPKTDVDLFRKYTDEQFQVLRTIAFRNFQHEVGTDGLVGQLKLVDFGKKNRDSTRYGTAAWSQKEVEALLRNLGLPLDSPLSVLVVETLPQITNIFEHVSRLDRPDVAAAASTMAGAEQAGRVREGGRAVASLAAVAPRRPSPVDEDLGNRRLLRTSPLREVPVVCPPE
jgi:hypothetical protein